MPDQSENPPLPQFLRLLFVIVILVLMIGVALFFVPDLIVPRWPWALLPFNTRFLGAVYSGEFVAVLITLLAGRWAPARLTVPQAASFTAIVFLASLLSYQQFDFGRLITWGWFIIYAIPMLGMTYYTWQYRQLSSGGTAVPAPWRIYLLIQGTVLGLYGLGLFLAPATFSAFWPWGLDDFHGQMYSAIFITGGVGSLLLIRQAAPVELLTLGLTQLSLSALAILGLVVVDTAVHRVDWSASGTWLWIGAFAILALAGIGLAWQSRANRGT